MKIKKSQVTMLMIVGFVLFVIVSFVLYLSKTAVKKQSQQSIKKIQETAIDTQFIKEFVQNCLDKLTKDAIVLLGKQGGYIYASQGGTLVDYTDTDEGLFFVNYNELKVAYNIMPARSNIPDYPWHSFPYLTSASNAQIFNGYFGENKMPPLEKSEGPNSIQAQIESFIDENIASCMDFNIFRHQGYDIIMEEPKTQVTIGTSDVNVKSRVPIKISSIATKETSEIEDFSTKLNIGLRDMYLLTRNIIENDVENVRFNISDPENSDALTVEVLKNFFSDESRKIRADLIIVSDGKTQIAGKLFEYVFARRNRAPALHYIRPNKFSFPAGYLINRTDILKNNLQAEDPDEDHYNLNIFIGEFNIIPAEFPKRLDVPQIKFRVEINDDQLIDYQIITVNRK